MIDRKGAFRFANGSTNDPVMGVSKNDCPIKIALETHVKLMRTRRFIRKYSSLLFNDIIHFSASSYRFQIKINDEKLKWVTFVN